MEDTDFKTMPMTSINLKSKRGDKIYKKKNLEKIILGWDWILFPSLHMLNVKWVVLEELEWKKNTFVSACPLAQMVGPEKGRMVSGDL